MFLTILAGLFPVFLNTAFVHSKITSIYPSVTNAKIGCELLVRPASGFMSIADERITISVIVTCTTSETSSSNVDKTQLSQSNQSFLLISEELSINAHSEDSSIVLFQPKYGYENILGPIFNNRSTTAVPVMQPRFHGVHVIKFRPGISQSLQWCAFPRLLGRTNIIFTVRKFRSESNSTVFGDVIAERSYLVKVSRNFRAKDMVFRSAMALAATISAAGLGCGTDIYAMMDIIRMQHKKIRGSVGIVAAVIQAVIRIMLLPGLCLGIGLLVGLSHTSIGGLILWSTTSGGGISYILSSAVEGNEELTVFLELVSAALGIVFTPLWMYFSSFAMLDIFDDEYDATIGMSWLYLFLIALNLPIIIGIAVREYFPLMAHIYIAWVLRPSMLLFFILFITLGIYSNLTVISEISAVDIISLGIVIALAMLITLIVSRFLNWPEHVTKALMSEQCSSNILLTLSLCRLALRAPERDAFTKMIFLAVFYSPMPFFLIKICVVTKTQITNIYSKQHQQQVSIAGGLADVVRSSIVSKQGNLSSPSTVKQEISSTVGHFMQDSAITGGQKADIVSAL